MPFDDISEVNIRRVLADKVLPALANKPLIVRFRFNAPTGNSMADVEWVSDPSAPSTRPTDAEVLTAANELENDEIEEQNNRNTTVQQVQNIAQSAVGVRIQDLTATQLQALLAILLWKERALEVENGTDVIVRPLNEWVNF